MADAGALHCPNCGGPAAPGDAACKYCKTTLATVSCPSCCALMFEQLDNLKDEERRLRAAQSVQPPTGREGPARPSGRLWIYFRFWTILRGDESAWLPKGRA